MAKVHIQDLLEQLTLFNVPGTLAKAMTEVAGRFCQIQQSRDSGYPQAILQAQCLGLDGAYHRLINAIHEEIQTHTHFSNGKCPSCGKGVRVQCASFSSHVCHDMEKRGHCPGRVSESGN